MNFRKRVSKKEFLLPLYGKLNVLVPTLVLFILGSL